MQPAPIGSEAIRRRPPGAARRRPADRLPRRTARRVCQPARGPDCGLWESSVPRGSETPRIPGFSARGPRRSNRKSPARTRKLKMTINPRFFTLSPPDRNCRTKSWTSHCSPRRGPAWGIGSQSHAQLDASQHLSTSVLSIGSTKPDCVLQYDTGCCPIPVLGGSK